MAYPPVAENCKPMALIQQPTTPLMDRTHILSTSTMPSSSSMNLRSSTASLHSASAAEQDSDIS